MRSTLPSRHFLLLLLLGVVWADEQKIQDSTSQGRQLFPVKNENSGNVRIYGSKQALTGFISRQNQQQQQQQRQKQQQQQVRPQKPSSKVPQTLPKYKKVPMPGLHPSLSPQQYLDSFNEIQGNKISSEHDLSGSSSSIAEKKTGQSRSPALSALALMGFLYFLNRMQDVLQGKRKRRDVQDFRYGEEGLNQYLDAIDYMVEKFQDVLPEGGEGAESSGRALSALFGDFFSYGDEGEEGVEGRAFRVLSYLGAFFAKIPEALGITNRASSRNDDLGGYPSAPDPPSGGFWGIFGERVGLVAKIMDFLDDPSPTRIGRSQDEVENEEIDPKEDYAVPSDLSPEDRSYLPPFAREAEHSRRRRFAQDDMNVWYSVAEEEEELSDGGGHRSNEMLGMMLRLFKNVLAA